MVKFIHFSDLHLDHFLRGRYDKEYGIPFRAADTHRLLEIVVSEALTRQVDFVLFAGDAYHTSTPKQEYKSLFHESVLRLSDAGIPLYAVPGNHDMTKRSAAKNALHELSSLRVPRVHVFHEPGVYERHDCTIVGIPWLYEPFDINTLEIPQGKPCFAVVHATILGAVYGSGTDTSELVLGREFVLDLDDLLRFDYTALGHIHTPQILHENPYVVYPGSVGLHSWGEFKDTNHYWVYFENGEIELGVFEDRPRVFLDLTAGDTLPDTADSETMYRVMVDPDAQVDLIGAQMENAFSAEVIKTARREPIKKRENLYPEIDNDKPMEEVIKVYFETVLEEDFGPYEKLFHEIAEEAK